MRAICSIQEVRLFEPKLVTVGSHQIKGSAVDTSYGADGPLPLEQLDVFNGHCVQFKLKRK